MRQSTMTSGTVDALSSRMPHTLRLSSIAAIVAASFVSTAASALPPLRANRDRPPPRKASSVTGRAGNAALTSRFLIGKDGQTQLDATTGELDVPVSGAGTLSKLQLKAFNGQGDVQWTRNFNEVSGSSARYMLAGLQRYQPLQVQANIRGVDGPRTNVLTVSGNVLRRPDLEVRGVEAPASIVESSWFNVIANVDEKNGDVGATASCKLFVDGAQVDEARGIFLEAGSFAGCIFTIHLDTLGAHTLRVVVDDVTPSDWDGANNAAEAHVDVVPAVTPSYRWGAHAASYAGHYDSGAEGWYRIVDGAYSEEADWHSREVRDGRWQIASIGLDAAKRIRFPLVRAEGAYRTNGITFGAFAADDTIANAWNWGDDVIGESGVSFSQNGTAVFIAGGSDLDHEYGRMDIVHLADDYLFSGGSYQRFWYSWVGGESYGSTYSWFGEYPVRNGTITPFGETVSAALHVVDARGAAYDIDTTFPTTSTVAKFDEPMSCLDVPMDNGTAHLCSEFHIDMTLRFGDAGGDVLP